jgi:hypothetical protein
MAKNARSREDERHVNPDYQSGGAVDGDQNFTSGSEIPPDVATRQNGGGEGIAEASDQGSTAGDGKKGLTAEEKAKKFADLASLRASNALDAMRLLGHCANTSQYAFTQEQVEKMLAALQASIDALRVSYEAALKPREEGERRKRGDRQLSFRV